MRHEVKKEYGISEYRTSITPSEMEMIAQAANRCKKVLDNHKSQEKKVCKVYLDDDEIEKMYAILACISKEYTLREFNTIEVFLENLHKPSEEIKKDIEKENAENV